MQILRRTNSGPHMHSHIRSSARMHNEIITGATDFMHRYEILPIGKEIPMKVLQ